MRLNGLISCCALLLIACGSNACSGTTEPLEHSGDPAHASLSGAERASTTELPANVPPVPPPTTTAPPTAAPVAPTTDAGWTSFEAGPLTRAVYVSNAGQDDWPGTEDKPKASLQAGYDALRDGSADWLLMRRGDTWRINDMFTWSKAGPRGTAGGWMRWAAYGDEAKPRPVIDSGAQSALVITPGWRSDRVIENVAISDIHFVASERLANPTSAQADRVGLQLVAVEHRGSALPFSHLLIENVKIEGFSMGFTSSQDVEHLALRRNVFYRIFSPGGAGVHSSAVVTGAQGLLIEGNVFYLCQYPGTLGVTAFSWFSHSAYIGAEATEVVVRDNFIIKAFEGMMQRAGGVYEHNVSAHNALGYHLGEAIGVVPKAGGVEAWVRGNLLLNNDGGINVGNTRAADISDNVLINDQQGSANVPNLTLIGRNDQQGNGRVIGSNIGVHHATITRNHLSGDLLYAADRQDRRHYSDVVFSANASTVGRVPVSISGYLSKQGWSGSTIDDLAKRLVSIDRKDYAPANTTLPLINYYRTALGLPQLP